MSTDNGGPAFPKINYVGDEQVCSYEGMTLRDYFAAKAMLGIITDPHHDTSDMGGYEQIAKYAYSLADAMIQERSK